jgi:hypothetical protein
MSERFAAANWTADRGEYGMPDRYRGTPKEYLWLAFKSGAAMPLGERRLRSILGGGAPAGSAPRQAPESRLTGCMVPDK